MLNQSEIHSASASHLHVWVQPEDFVYITGNVVSCRQWEKKNPSVRDSALTTLSTHFLILFLLSSSNCFLLLFISTFSGPVH